jgi:hypothetical protein
MGVQCLLGNGRRDDSIFRECSAAGGVGVAKRNTLSQ